MRTTGGFVEVYPLPVEVTEIVSTTPSKIVDDAVAL
jgi:hypothetical protein